LDIEAREDCISVKKWVMQPKERVKEEYYGPPPTQKASDSLDAVSLITCLHKSTNWLMRLSAV